jgi:hypothetical protein
VQGQKVKPVFIREASPEVTAKVDHARSIIRGNGAFNIESCMLHLAENHHDLLESITAQCDVSDKDRDFWRLELCNPLPPEEGVGPAHITRQEWVQILWGFTVLLHDSRRFLRVHKGNPEYASTKLMREAVKRCNAGNLERTTEMLKASLFMGVIRADCDGNEDGRNNELLCYMADHIDQIEIQMIWLTAAELSIGSLEARFDGSTHSTLTSGWL